MTFAPFTSEAVGQAGKPLPIRTAPNTITGARPARASRSVDPGLPPTAPIPSSPLHPGSIYHCAWWLDAATDGDWQLIETDADSGFVGRMPVCFKHAFGRRIMGMPPLTRTLGPEFHAVRSGIALTPRIRHRLLQQLVARMPDLPCNQLYDPACTDLLPFRLAGFQIEVEYTARILDCTDPAAIWKTLRDKIRNEIRRSQERYTVGTELSVSDFVAFYAANIRNSARRMVPDAARVTKVLDAVVAHGAGRLLSCVDRDGNLAAAIFVVQDRSFCHYLLSTRDPRLSDNGAVSLLLLKAIEAAGQAGIGFDFDGFGTQRIASFLRQFGAELAPRWRVSRMPAWLRVIRMLQVAKQPI